MQTLQINKNNARKLYRTAAPEFKQMLVDTFGETFFSEKITDRIKTFEDACEALGKKPSHILSADDTADETAYKKLKIIVKALNEGWTPDWNNSNETKFYPWFYLNSPGFRLTYVHWYFTASTVGSLLCFKSEELALYAVAQFPDLYKDFFTI
jgi:FMN phosphatase YigB (HAD superfamily)